MDDMLSPSTQQPVPRAGCRDWLRANRLVAVLLTLAGACTIALVVPAARDGARFLSLLFPLLSLCSCTVAIMLYISLRHSQLKAEMIASVVESATDLIGVCDPSGRVTYRNAAFRAFQDGDAGTGRGKSKRTLRASEQFLNTALPCAIRDGVWSGASLMSRFDGEMVPVSQIVTAHRDARTSRLTHLTTISRDVSFSKSVVESLRDTQRFTQRVTDATPYVVYIYNIDDQRSCYLNSRIADVLGYSRDALSESIPTLLDGIVHPNDASIFRNALKTISEARDGEVVTYEYRAKSKDERYIWLHCRDTVFRRDSEGRVIELLGTAIDITTHKETESALREDRERYTSIVAAQSQMMEAELRADQILAVALEGVVKISGASGASIDTRGPLLSIPGCSVGSIEHMSDDPSLLILELIRKCYATAQVQHLRDVMIGQEYTSALSSHSDFRSAIVLPLLGSGDVIGSLTVVSNHPDTFDELKVQALQQMTNTAATALTRAIMFQSRQELFSERTGELDNLLASEDSFRSAMGAFHEAMVLRDATGVVKEANESVESILGFKVEELFGITSPTAEWTLINEDRSEFDLSLMPDLVALRTGQAQAEISFGIERADGTVTWLSVSAAPLFYNDSTEPYAAVSTFRDITERKAAAEANARLAAIVDSSQDGIFGTTLEGVIVNWNPGAEHLFGYDESEIIGCNYSVLNSLEDVMAFRNMTKSLVIGEEKESQECIHYRSDGSPVQVSMTYSLIHNSGGEPVGVAAIARDITERKQYEMQIEKHMQQINEINAALQLQKEQLEVANRQLAALATLDGLTGLKNHRAFQDRLREELQRALRYNTPLSVFLLDVDQFKAFNDSFGHPAGDEVLRIVGSVLTENCRASDVVARYGGEEFIVILPQTGSVGASIIAERCRQMIEEQVWTLRSVTASFGIATLDVQMGTAEDLISWADQAMYRSKMDGKNRVTHARGIATQGLATAIG